MIIKVFAILGTIALGLTAWPGAGEAQLFGSSKADAETNVRLNDMEENLRKMTGQVEELSYQLRVLQDQIRRMQEDNEYRLQQLEGGGGGKRSGAAPLPQSGTDTASTQQGAPPAVLGQIDGSYGPAADPAAGSGVPAGSGDAEFGSSGGYSSGGGPLDLSALARGQGGINPAGGDPSGQNGPIDGGALPGVGSGAASSDALPGSDPIGDQLAAAGPGGDPRAAYDEAYNAMLSGDYASAQAGFGMFLADFPDHTLAGNAQYWLGESYYAQGRYRDAADTFLKSYTDYPDGAKVTDSLLKLGLSLKGIGEKDAACATFSELLSKYPNAPVAVRSEAQAEQQRASCS